MAQTKNKSHNSKEQIAIIGGGAAGFFFAANASELYPHCAFTIFEQGKTCLQKVKISGGGRCNVTNAIEEPQELVLNYPRGEKELLGPFYGFNSAHTSRWFKLRGVKLKTEADGRKFPITDNSQTVIDCLVNTCKQNGVQIKTSTKVSTIQAIENGKKGFQLQIKNEPTHFNKVFLAPGSSKLMWNMLANMGHTIVSPIPSLFTFKIDDIRIQHLPGVSVENVQISIPQTNLNTNGPLLITHKGLSGPAVLKLSAFGARVFHQKNYQSNIVINFLPNLSMQQIKRIRDQKGKELVNNYKLFPLPKRLFQSLITHAKVDEQLKWASVSNSDLATIYHALCKAEFKVTGQNRFKEEFVTAGGVELKEVDFTNFSSKKIENLYFAGEVLNIDALTGGFNFQAAWTGAYLAALGLFD